MKLSELFKDVPVIASTCDMDGDITALQYDSRNVTPGDLFVALKGGKLDGHDYVDAAIRHGARAVVVEKPPPGKSIPCIRVGNTRMALAHIAAAFYGHPSREMMMIGITGTNGKTSTAYLIDSILREAGLRTGLLGTIAYHVGPEEFTAGWTTPESLTLHQLLHSMSRHNTEAVVMEISSHALDQHRVEGLVFRLAVFTNLSQDHLDYHRSMEEYLAAKQRLFQKVDTVKGENIINGDDPASQEMVRLNRRPVFSYSATPGKSDLFPESAEFSFSGIVANISSPRGTLAVRSPLLGRHNLPNILAAVSTGICLDIPLPVIERGIKNLTAIPGRLEPVNEGQPFSVFVDFAHTPDAVEKAVAAVREFVRGRLIVVFGCGGDKDRTKRPLMGRAAEEGADRVILTSDNPRSENPLQIAGDILAGVRNREAIKVLTDRFDAIQYALTNADRGDCVLILGKGHETCQEIGAKKIPFDDREVARKILRGL